MVHNYTCSIMGIMEGVEKMKKETKIKELKVKKIKGYAFHVDRFASDEAWDYAKEYDLELICMNRDNQFLKHEVFLESLSSYEYYIDVKRDFPGHKAEGKILEAMSLTGLEALALGCKVIDWKGEVHEGLPPEHRSENVAKLLHEFYSWGWK